jgi:hypothetical protein
MLSFKGMNLMTHKYRIGQMVKLLAGRFADRTGAARIYEIVRLLPEVNGEFGYRIKGANELNERAVGEHEITAAAAH